MGHGLDHTNYQLWKATKPEQYQKMLAYHRAYQKKRRTSAGHEDRCAWRTFRNKLTAYNLTLDQYHAIAERQDFGCAICGAEETLKGKTRLGIDHDHHTGKVRGLLCHKRNLVLGHANDTPTILTSALKYLQTRGEVVRCL